jgi:chromosome segregation ATPase
MGFLFTLTSLAYSLWEFSRNKSTTDVIIGNFAIALGTTILGLALRVLFQQFREDPMEIEQQVRLEIADRVTELRSQLTHVVEDLSSLSTTVRTELKDRFAESLAHVTAAAVERLKVSYDTHIEMMQHSLKAFQKTSEALQQEATASRGAHKRMVEAIDRFTERIARSRVPTESLEKSVQELTALVAKALDAERGRAERDRQSMEHLREASEAAIAAFASVSKAAPALLECTEATMSEVKMLGGTLAATGQAALDQVEALKKVQTAHSEILDALLSSSRSGLSTVNENERQMADAVARGRKAVTDTQASLASLARVVVERLNAS